MIIIVEIYIRIEIDCCRWCMTYFYGQTRKLTSPWFPQHKACRNFHLDFRLLHKMTCLCASQCFKTTSKWSTVWSHDFNVITTTIRSLKKVEQFDDCWQQLLLRHMILADFMSYNKMLSCANHRPSFRHLIENPFNLRSGKCKFKNANILPSSLFGLVSVALIFGTVQRWRWKADVYLLCSFQLPIYRCWH